MTQDLLKTFMLIILTSCSQSNLLTYKNRKNFKEVTRISHETNIKINHLICYNKPNVIDEEFCYDLTLNFLDTAEAKKRKMLNLEIDTLIVKSSYEISSVWRWEEVRNKVTGYIEIIDWDKNSVTLKEDILAFEERSKKTKKFKGTRVYKIN